MRRREFIAGLGGAVAWPVVARAQEAKTLMIGWLRGTTPAGSEHMVAGFRQGLSETGYFEGRNVMIHYWWADSHLDREFALAADLVHRQVNVIATVGTISAALAAKAATTTIPIVFSTGGDPVTGGLVTSLSRPTGNLTGISSLATAVDTKRLELLLRLLPQATRIAGLVVPIGRTERTNLDPHSVDHQGVTFVMSNGIPIPRWSHLRGVMLVHAHLTELISVRIKDRDLVGLLDELHRGICQN
jgi:putative tryptophan/tyrosine transport system substrate-binding protein